MQATGVDLEPSSLTPPLPAQFLHLQPNDVRGGVYAVFAIGLTALATAFSLSTHLLVWLTGQFLLALAFLMWFAVLHETGHKNLFRTPVFNLLVGQLAGVLAFIPFHNWKLVHARHHRWAGWHDLDPTTSQSLPRKLNPLEKVFINVSWWLWIPVFSVVYRLQNYWHLPRLWKQFPRRSQRWQIATSTLICIAVYGVTAFWLGPLGLLFLCGLGLYVSLVMQDLLILSQHTHLAMPQSEGRDVRPFPPVQQEQYTRSLIFPSWFSRSLLLNIDAHELHHMYPRVPGYWLQEIPYRPKNAISWWHWVWRAKRIRGDVLLFQNRNQTGYEI